MSKSLKMQGNGYQSPQGKLLQIQIHDSFNEESIQLFQQKLSYQQRKKSMPVLKQKPHFDYDKSNLQTTYVLEQNTEKSQRNLDGEISKITSRKSKNQAASERFLLQQISSFRSSHHSPLNDRAIYQQSNENIKKIPGTFESLNEIGQRLKLQYHGKASTPQSGSAKSSKNSTHSNFQQKSNQNIAFFSAQSQQHRDSIQNNQEQNRKSAQTPKLKVSVNQNFSLLQSPQTSRFNQTYVKESSDSIKINAQKLNNHQNLHIDLKFLAENSASQIASQNGQKEKKVDLSKQNWGRPITEEKQRFMSVDQHNANDILFENKKDDEKLLKKTVPLFNKNFLGIQLALNNKTCLKSLLVSQNKSNDNKKEDFQSYSKNYRSQKLQNLIFDSTLQEHMPNQITKKILGGVLNSQRDSPFHSSQSANSPSYSEAFFKNIGSKTAKFSLNDRLENRAHINLGGFSTTTHRFYNQKSDQNMNNKWKYNQNIEDKNIANSCSQRSSHFNDMINNRSNNQIYLQNNSSSYKQLSSNLGLKLSTPFLPSSNNISRRSSHNIVNINQFDEDDTLQRKNSLQRISIKVPSDNKLDKQQQSMKITSLVLQNIDHQGNEHDTSFEQQGQIKFTKISEENDNLLNNENFPNKLKDIILEQKKRSSSSYQQFLQQQISKQIGIDLKNCMPKKIKIDKLRKQSSSYDHRGQKLFSKVQIQVCFEEIQKQITQKISDDYNYKLMINEMSLNSEQFLERLLIFISYCLNQNLTNSSQSVPKLHKQVQQKSQLTVETQMTSPRQQYKIQENKLQDQLELNNFLQRTKIKSNGVFRLSTSSQQTLKNIFSDLAIPFQFQQMIIEDIIEIFKQRVQDSNALQIFQDHLKKGIQTILIPKLIIQEIGGKLNTKRIFIQVFEHLEDSYFVTKQNYILDSISGKKQDDNNLNLFKTNESLAIDFLISLINNEIRSFDNEKSLIQFSQLHFFFFKLAIQNVCQRQGLTYKQTYQLLERIELNRETLCSSDYNQITISDFAQKRQLASQLLHQNFTNQFIINSDENNITNSFILLESIIDFINSKIKCQQFIYLILKKFKPEAVKNGLLINLYEFAKENIFPKGLKQSQEETLNHPLLLQFKRKIQFIQDENISAISPSKLWPLEQKDNLWQEMIKKIKSSSQNNTLSYIKDSKQIAQFSESKDLQQNKNQESSIKQFQKYLNSLNINAQEELQSSRQTKNFSDQETEVMNSDARQQSLTVNSHNVFNSSSLSFLKYIYDFAFSFFDIFSATDIEAAKRFYQVDYHLFDYWMNLIKSDIQYPQQQIVNEQISYLKKYSLLY